MQISKGCNRYLVLAAVVWSAIFTYNTTESLAAPPVYIVNGLIQQEASQDPSDDMKKIEFVSSAVNQYSDSANGYSLLYPSQMSVDVSLSDICTVFSDSTTRIEVYYDNFQGSVTTPEEYISYSNKYVASTASHKVYTDRWGRINGYRAHLLEWSRPSLARVDGDKHYYATVEMIKNSSEVYTVFIKSKEPIENAIDLVSGLTLVERQGVARNSKKNGTSTTQMNAETKAFYDKFFSPKSSLRFGMFEPSAPQTMRELNELEDKLNFQFPVLLQYQMMDNYFPSIGLEHAFEQGRTVELTLQTVYSGDANALWAGTNRNVSMVYEILDGKYDDYLVEYAQHLKDFGHPVIFRLDNEMNGDWCWYSAFYTGKDAELYKDLWRYIHDVFAKNGVDNVIWVWNPHDLSRPNFKWNHYIMYYPGDEYVDVIGMTGYNTGTYFEGERWREFDEIYPPLYKEYSLLFDKPFMITEFASNSVGGDKVAWLKKMFTGLKGLDRIKVAVWWSGIDRDQQGNPGRIYLLDENDAVITAFKEGLKTFKEKGAEEQTAPNAILNKK